MTEVPRMTGPELRRPFSESSDLNFQDMRILGRDFQGRDLRRADFRNASIHNVDFQGADLRRADFTDAEVTADFRNARLQGARLGARCFTGSDLRGADCRGCDFEDTDLTEVRLSGCDLRGANLSHTTGLTRNQFRAALSDEATLPPEAWEEDRVPPDARWAVAAAEKLGFKVSDASRQRAGLRKPSV